MMLFHLIRKDIIIVKKYVLIMVIAAIAIPPFMLWRAPEYTGVLGFILSIMFSVFMLLQYVSLKEYQFPKAATLLCSTPFSRKMMVLSKYIFCIAMYMTCCIIFGIETLFIPGLGTEYSCAMKSHFRKSGNQMSGKWKSSCASLLAQCFI